jgi:hypothetical protein
MTNENESDFRAALAAFVEKASAFVSRIAASPKKMTTVEFGAAAIDLMRLCVSTLEAASAMTGAQKKAVTMGAVEHLFDAVADRCVPPFAKPIWWIARPTIKAIYLAAADGAVERILAMVRLAEGQNGVPAASGENP